MENLLNLIYFFLGCITTLLVTQIFVHFLPGSKVFGRINEIRPTEGNAVGGIYYLLELDIKNPIEYLYFKIQFPATVNNNIIGFPQEIIQVNNKFVMQAFELGKNENGQHIVVQAAINCNENIIVSSSGNMLNVRASKLSHKTKIIGIVATTEGKTNINPSPAIIYIEGEYEYIKLSQLVRKKIKTKDFDINIS